MMKKRENTGWLCPVQDPSDPLYHVIYCEEDSAAPAPGPLPAEVVIAIALAFRHLAIDEDSVASPWQQSSRVKSVSQRFNANRRATK